jgi:FtsH-binding integral membrane protein
MGVELLQLWYLVIAATALAGWWLAVRPRASYGGIAGTMSVLILLMAVLLCVLAMSGQQGGGRSRPAQITSVERPQLGLER